jgi:hypothetical protein
VIIYYISKVREIEKKCKGDPFIQHDYIYLFIILDLSLMLFEMFEEKKITKLTGIQID